MKYIICFFAVISFQLVSGARTRGQERYVDSLIDWVNNNPTVDSQYILTLHRISYHTSESDIKTSFKYYEQVIMLSNELNFTYGKALGQINLGILLTESANFESSNDAYFKAIEFADQASASRLKAICLNNIAENFKQLKDYQKCREYTLKAIDINKDLKAWRGVAINYEMLFQCDLGDFLYKDARNNLDIGYPFSVLSKDNNIIGLYEIGYGKITALSGDMKGAEVFFGKAMDLAVKENNQRNKFYVFLARGKYLKYSGDKVLLSDLDSAYAIAKSLGYLNGIGQAAQLLSDLYDRVHKKDSSLKYFHIYRTSFDNMFSENNKRNVIIKEFDWMIRQKEIENRHLEQLASIQKKELGIKNILIVAILAMFILSGAIAFFIYQNIRVSRKKQKAEFEKELLRVRMISLQSQMNPHFIFNSLNSIENFVMHNDKLAASEYLNKFASLVRIILESSKMDSIPFPTSLQAIQNYVELERLRFNNKFEVTYDIDPELFNREYRVPSLIIQPYVENAIIHGLAPSEKKYLHLKLNVFIEDGYITYVVEDNGIGRELSKKYQKENLSHHKSMGIRLTQEKMNIYRLQNNTSTDVQIIDLYENDEAVGTRIVLRLKIN